MDPSFPHAVPSRQIVLLIADDVETLALTALALQFAGFEVAAARTVGEGSTHCRRVRPDVIVADLQQGSGQHWALLRDLWADMAPRAPPLVLVIEDGASIPATVEPSCAAVVARPIDAATVVEVVLAVLR